MSGRGEMCARCGATLDEGKRFCTACGTATGSAPSADASPERPSARPSCAACGTPLTAGDGFCSACGARATAQAPTSGTAATRATSAQRSPHDAPMTPPAAEADGRSWLRRHRILAIAGAIVIVLVGIYGLVSLRGDDSHSNSQSAAPAATALPHAVTNLSAKENGDRLLLSFVSPAADRPYVTDYTAEYRIAGGGTWAPVDDWRTPRTSITVSGLKAGETYSFRVAAINSMGRGPWAELQAEAPASRCSNETLGDLYGDEVDAWWRVTSVENAWFENEIDEAVLERRLRKRLTAYAATYKALVKACAAPTIEQKPLLSAEAAAYSADVAYARFLLRAIAGRKGTEAEFDRLSNARAVTTKAADAEWQAFADANGITLSPPTPIDETKATD